MEFLEKNNDKRHYEKFDKNQPIVRQNISLEITEVLAYITKNYLDNK